MYLDDMNASMNKFVTDFEKMHEQVTEIDQEMKQHHVSMYLCETSCEINSNSNFIISARPDGTIWTG
jgi:hypothetical protein